MSFQLVCASLSLVLLLLLPLSACSLISSTSVLVSDRFRLLVSFFLHLMCVRSIMTMPTVDHTLLPYYYGCNLPFVWILFILLCLWLSFVRSFGHVRSSQCTQGRWSETILCCLLKIKKQPTSSIILAIIQHFAIRSFIIIIIIIFLHLFDLRTNNKTKKMSLETKVVFQRIYLLSFRTNWSSRWK